MKYKIIWEARYKSYRNWVGYFLYGINPSLYETSESLEETKRKLTRFYKSLPEMMVKFKLGYKPLKDFATIQLRNDTLLIIKTRTGQTSIEFKIKDE